MYPDSSEQTRSSHTTLPLNTLSIQVVLLGLAEAYRFNGAGPNGFAEGSDTL